MNVLPLEGWNMLQIWNYLANTVQRGRYMFIDIIIIQIMITLDTTITFAMKYWYSYILPLILNKY